MRKLLDAKGSPISHGRPTVNLTGLRFGKLIVTKPAPSKNGRMHWFCVCRCGRNKIIMAKALLDGWSASCGGCEVNEFRPSEFPRQFIDRIKARKEFSRHWRIKLASTAKGREHVNESARRYRKKYPDRYRANLRERYWANPEEARNRAKVFRESRKCDPKRLAAYRNYCREKTAARFKTDLNFRLRFRIRGRIWGALKRGVMKQGGTVELLGCSIPKLRKHLESRWRRGMTWANYSTSGWHIDHKIPCVKFDLTKKAQQKKCFHYTNLRPLWAKENLSRGIKAI